MKYLCIFNIIIYSFIPIFILSAKDYKFIKIEFTEEYLVPTITAQLKEKNFSFILDNNLGLNYISTKDFNLTHINPISNDDKKINIKDKIYVSYLYLGTISIFFEKNIIYLENFNPYVIDDNKISSSITLHYLLMQLYIIKQDFYLDINNKNLYLGDIPFQSELYSDMYNNDKIIKVTFYSDNEKFVFNQKLKNLYIDNQALLINKFTLFTINDYITIVPLSLLNDIIKNQNIQKLDCNLILIDKRGIYAIKCHKNDINKLPNLNFVFNNDYTFNIPFHLLFVDYDDNYKISLIRNKIKKKNLAQKKDDSEEIIIGYSLIKLFNYTKFTYDEMSMSFFSDKFISNHPPKFLNEYIYVLLYLLFFLLLFTIPFLIYIKLKLKQKLSNKKYNNNYINNYINFFNIL